MCEFCTKHGDGKRWYLEAKNYSDDLVSDLRRQSFIREFTGAVVSDDAARNLQAQFHKLTRIASLPRPLRRLVSWYVTRRMKKLHFGQVVPIEGIAEVLKLVSSIVRLPCICRRTMRGEEHHYCLGISVKPDFGLLGQAVRAGYEEGPDIEDFERLTGEQALALMGKWESDGLMHSLWTFGTPFIAGICNCDRSDCMAMRATIGANVKVMFRAEFVAALTEELCTGCRACMRVCQFGAIGYSAGRKKVFVDQSRCYGCGVCRSVCPEGAINLLDRASVPAVANVW